MKGKADTTLVRIVGVLALLVIAVAIWLAVVNGQFLSAPDEILPGGFMNRGLAMQFVADGADVGRILAPDVSHNRGVMRRLMLVDFLFIGGYGLLFVTITILLARRNCPWARYLALTALVAGVMAAAFDVRENIFILKTLKCFPCDPQTIDTINNSALTKWTMSFVAIALLAIAFQDLANRFAYWISASFIVAAAIGLVGLWRPQLLFLAQIPLLIGLALLVVTAFGWPLKLRESRD